MTVQSKLNLNLILAFANSLAPNSPVSNSSGSSARNLTQSFSKTSFPKAFTDKRTLAIGTTAFSFIGDTTDLGAGAGKMLDGVSRDVNTLALLLIENLSDTNVIQFKSAALNSFAGLTADPSDIIPIQPGQFLLATWPAGFSMGTDVDWEIVATAAGDFQFTVVGSQV